MTRRGFFASILVALLGAPLALKLGLTKPAPEIIPEGNGISIKMSRKFDFYKDAFVTRFDVLYGIGWHNPNLAARVISYPRLTHAQRVFDPMRLPA